MLTISIIVLPEPQLHRLQGRVLAGFGTPKTAQFPSVPTIVSLAAAHSTSRVWIPPDAHDGSMFLVNSMVVVCAHTTHMCPHDLNTSAHQSMRKVYMLYPCSNHSHYLFLNKYRDHITQFCSSMRKANVTSGRQEPWWLVWWSQSLLPGIQRSLVKSGWGQ